MTTSGHGRRRLAAAIRLAGFLVGVALFVALIRFALSRMDEQSWEQLRAAPWWQLALLLALAGVSIALNGALWWVAIRPVRAGRSPTLGAMVCVNAIATALAYAPFKPSVVFRVLYHRAIDGIPLLQFGGWAFAVGAGMAAGLLPPLAASATPALRDRPELWFAAAVLGGVAAAFAGVRASRYFTAGAGWRTIRRTAGRIAGRRGVRALRTDAFQNLHAGLHMLTRHAPVLAAVAMRQLDVASTATRFLVAAAILGVELPLIDAMVAGASYFLLAALVPTGSAGVREVGTLGVFAVIGVDAAAVTPVIVLVAAAQIVAALALAAVAALALGPARLRALRGSRAAVVRDER